MMTGMRRRIMANRLRVMRGMPVSRSRAEADRWIHGLDGPESTTGLGGGLETGSCRVAKRGRG